MRLKVVVFLAVVLCVNNIQGFGIPPKKVQTIKENVVPQPEITKAHIIFMNHLDVGYSDYVVGLTGFSANVLNSYFNIFFPRAIALSRQMRSDGYVEQFRYTTHAWLLHLYLHCPPNLVLANIKVNCPNAANLSSMFQAIKDGDILWHDGPMNMNFENMNAFGLTLALNISANLNREFGIKKPFRVISLRDVPGLSRGVIRTLLANNVIGISSGVNSGSAPPALAPLTRWRAAPRYNGETDIPEIILMQNPHGYPDPIGPSPNNPGGISASNCHQAPGSTEVLCFMFRSDNNGPPQSEAEVLLTYEILRARYVNAKIMASTFEDFFTIIWKNIKQLPLVDKEIGDTWIQGTASDPKKFARFRCMQREFEYYFKTNLPITDAYVNASRFLIKPAEHTYGLSGCGDQINWRNDQFQKIRNNPGMVNEELSWVEQRQYEQLVLDSLGPNHRLTKVIEEDFKEMETLDTFKESDYQIMQRNLKTNSDDPYNFTCTSNGHSIVVGFQHGAIVYLAAENILVTPANALGKLIYRTYNESDTNFFLKYYETTWNTGYGKPNSTLNAAPESKEWEVVMKSIYKKVDTPCSFLLVVATKNSTATSYYGFPAEVFIAWDIDIKHGEISTEVFWDQKLPTRLMESISFSFNPAIVDKTYDWYFSKMGEPISPHSVIFNGSQWQHNVDDGGVFIARGPNVDPIFKIIPWDTGITCPITASYGPTVWPAPLFPIQEPLTGVAFNIYNNVWNTNYIYWYPFNGEGTENDRIFKARFSTSVKLITSKVANDDLRYE